MYASLLMFHILKLTEDDQLLMIVASTYVVVFFSFFPETDVRH